MGKIVLGIGTSHSSLVSIPGAYWADQGKNDIAHSDLFRPDGSNVGYEQLAAEAGDRFKDIVCEPHFTKLAVLIRAAQDRLADEVTRAKPDLLVVIGDDQAELLDKSVMPALAIYSGAELTNDPKRPGEAHEWQKPWREAATLDAARHYPGAPEFANELIERLIEKEFDVAVVVQPAASNKGIGHAWAFVVNRLVIGPPVPVVPVILNTWYPPNILTPARCFGLGQALRAAIEESPRELRVGVVVAGGMSHLVLNEELDRRVMAALQAGDSQTLTTIPREALRGGSGQIRDWIVLAGAVAGLDNRWAEYYPGYRTPGGTGTGLAFAAWS